MTLHSERSLALSFWTAAYEGQDFFRGLSCAQRILSPPKSAPIKTEFNWVHGLTEVG